MPWEGVNSDATQSRSNYPPCFFSTAICSICSTTNASSGETLNPIHRSSVLSRLARARLRYLFRLDNLTIFGGRKKTSRELRSENPPPLASPRIASEGNCILWSAKHSGEEVRKIVTVLRRMSLTLGEEKLKLPIDERARRKRVTAAAISGGLI